ncbi:carboxypeptidase regulatory-like domain-containing protein [Candidatus Brocadia sp. AMX2]|uniref:carboxypeptidase regulatory-like domain-containing protein n=1 Tax=Candidatus Brocadia sp. AMX2 TaxID=2293635 RepID=UPI00255534DB|nr:carboxypeptidase regulatory-like domain-containing protein [Candidatus Brocadia sp. AMX2]
MILANSPVQVSNLSDVAALAGGRFHSLALKSDGTVWAWGQNDSGQLGNGTAGNSTVPGQVKNLSNVIAIERGRSHSLAAKSDGTVWGWGDNSYGQLGNGATSNSTVPVQVKNLSDVAVIGGGGFHSLGLKSEGTVWAWGRNNSGQLGDGTTKDSAIPVQVFIDLSIETGNIAGVVKDATIGAGINNATVTLDDQSNTTTTSRIRGQDGVYKFRDVSAGNHTLSVQATGFETGTQSITVEKGQPNPKTGRNIFNFALISTAFPTPTPTPGTGNLGGQVTDVGTGGGIVGATVSTDTGLTTTTVKNGAYAFRNIATGDYTLTASATGYTSASQSATVTTGKNTRADFALISGGTPTPTPTPAQTPTPGTGNLAGQVTDTGTGAGIVGATVSTDTGLTTTTVKNGIYTFRDITAGDYILTVFATGYGLASQSATVVAGKNTRADFALIPEIPTPTPEATPTPTCEADLLVASSKRLRLQTEESAEETITVFCENDIPLAGETITWKIKSGRKRITITPDSAVTNANGEARFTITATDRIGDAKIKFEGESADLKTTVTVKVIE